MLVCEGRGAKGRSLAVAPHAQYRGDANFMTTFGETRALPEDLTTTYKHYAKYSNNKSNAGMFGWAASLQNSFCWLPDIFACFINVALSVTDLHMRQSILKWVSKIKLWLDNYFPSLINEAGFAIWKVFNNHSSQPFRKAESHIELWSNSYLPRFINVAILSIYCDTC